MVANNYCAYADLKIHGLCLTIKVSSFLVYF